MKDKYGVNNKSNSIWVSMKLLWFQDAGIVRAPSWFRCIIAAKVKGGLLQQETCRRRKNYWFLIQIYEKLFIIYFAFQLLQNVSKYLFHSEKAVVVLRLSKSWS